MKDLVIRIVGTAGDGVISAGDIFALASARIGLYVTTHRSFPSEIRGGGQSLYQFKISSEKVLTPSDVTDILIALDENSLKSNIAELKEGGILIYDTSEPTELLDEYQNIIKYCVPISAIAKEKATIRSKNIVALGMLAGLFPNIKIKEQLKDDVRRRYSTKGEDVINTNILAIEVGYDYVRNELIRQDNLENIDMPLSGRKLIMSGNEAIAFAALAAGCKFYSGYPITPATEIMEWLAKEMPKVGGNVIQCEDEIASITAAIGASYSGAKAMTATSGPGLSLMSESIGLAAMAEIPLVIVDVQRGGPSTGLPTKTEQSDLNIAVYGTHGDTPKIVIAPINVEDCFYQTINAFNYAEKYQVPVIILSDASLGQRRECIDVIDLDKVKVVDRLKFNKSKDDQEYLRYEITETGVSPMSSPGDAGGAYVATGLEHTENCAPSYDSAVHAAMTEKRFRKLETAVHEFLPAKTYGPDSAKIGILSWGSSLGAVLEAIDMANEKGYSIQALYPRTVYPFPNEWINDFLRGKEILIILERNYSAQFANTIVYRCTCMYKDLKIYNFLKYDGEPFTSREIFNKIDELIKALSLKYTLSGPGISLGHKSIQFNNLDKA